MRQITRVNNKFQCQQNFMYNTVYDITFTFKKKVNVTPKVKLKKILIRYQIVIGIGCQC